MSDATVVSVSNYNTTIKVLINNIIFWSFILISVGGSKLLFGGSWVIDILVLLSAISWFCFTGLKIKGYSVSITKEENAKWVEAGMPDDVKAWKEANI